MVSINHWRPVYRVRRRCCPLNWTPLKGGLRRPFTFEEPIQIRRTQVVHCGPSTSSFLPRVTCCGQQNTCAAGRNNLKGGANAGRPSLLSERGVGLRLETVSHSDMLLEWPVCSVGYAIFQSLIQALSTTKPSFRRLPIVQYSARVLPSKAVH